MAITDPQAQFYAGLGQAAQHWLAFWQNNEHHPAALRRTRGHALRVLMWCAECDCHLDIAADLASAMHTHMIRTAEWHEWEACLRQVLLRASASLGEDRGCRVRFYLSELCMRMQRHDEARALAQENYRRGVCAGNLPQQLDATLVTAEVYLNAENYGPAREYAERGTALAIAAGKGQHDMKCLILKIGTTVPLQKMGYPRYNPRINPSVRQPCPTTQPWRGVSRIRLAHSPA